YALLMAENLNHQVFLQFIVPAGINLINPLAKVQEYSVQTKEHKEVMQVLSSEGLTIGLEISVLYRMNPDSAARVYQTIAGGGL
ncbi:MAG: SPFH domain-containing protein, partial [Bacteroidota bacterium]